MQCISACNAAVCVVQLNRLGHRWPCACIRMQLRMRAHSATCKSLCTGIVAVAGTRCWQHHGSSREGIWGWPRAHRSRGRKRGKSEPQHGRHTSRWCARILLRGWTNVQCGDGQTSNVGNGQAENVQLRDGGDWEQGIKEREVERLSVREERRSNYHQHMNSPQTAPMRCALRDVVAAWNVDLCQNTACRDEKCCSRQKWMLPTAKKEKKSY